MIFNVDLTMKHEKVMLNDLHILFLPGIKIRLRQNDPVLKDVHQQLPVFFSNLIIQSFSNSASHEIEILSLSWRISKSFHQIWVIEVSKTKSVSKYLESKNF